MLTPKATIKRGKWLLNRGQTGEGCYFPAKQGKCREKQGIYFNL